jgi:hypothetical protein
MVRPFVAYCIQKTDAPICEARRVGRGEKVQKFYQTLKIAAENPPSCRHDSHQEQLNAANPRPH